MLSKLSVILVRMYNHMFPSIILSLANLKKPYMVKPKYFLVVNTGIKSVNMHYFIKFVNNEIKR